ncbi:hypothetical protein AHAS_Ahas12G0125500 [Arachis hypogaea]
MDVDSEPLSSQDNVKDCMMTGVEENVNCICDCGVNSRKCVFVYMQLITCTKREHRPLTRTGCEAMLAVYFDTKTSTWRVKKLVEKHNHDLVPQCLVHLIPNHRELTESHKAQANTMHDNGLPTFKIMGLMVGQAGGKYLYAPWHLDEFDEYWKNKLKKYELEENCWVLNEYEKKKRWASAYLRDKFCARFRTTSSASHVKKKCPVRNDGGDSGDKTGSGTQASLGKEEVGNGFEEEQDEEFFVSGKTLIWRAVKLPIYAVALVPLTVASAVAYLQTGMFSARTYFVLLASSVLVIT